MKHISWITPLFATVLLSACTPPPGETVDTSAEDAAAIRASVTVFVEAWNAGNRDLVGPILAEDVIQLPPYGAAVKGREAVLDAVMEAYDLGQLKQSATVDEVVVFGDYAHAHGTWRLSPSAEAGPEVEGSSGKWMVTYRRTPDGLWPIWRWMWNQQPPTADE